MSTAMLTGPLPVPDAPLVTAIHGAFEVAIHAHPAPDDTVTVPLPPPDWKSSDGGAMANVQGAGPCAIVKVCPAIVAVPVLAAPPFCATARRTGPVPLPEAPDSIVIQGAWLAETHAHEAPAVTVTIDVPPAADIASLAGAIE
jgi:hypothetical protein